MRTSPHSHAASTLGTDAVCCLMARIKRLAAVRALKVYAVAAVLPYHDAGATWAFGVFSCRKIDFGLS